MLKMKNKEKYDLKKLHMFIYEVEKKSYRIFIYETLENNENKLLYENKKPVFSSKLIKIFTNWLEKEYEPDILDKTEKEYLSAVIKPFRSDIDWIEKVSFGNEYLIEIGMNSGQFIQLPFFDIKRKMYLGMELHKEYSLEELGL